jgi:hypothetical protein
MERSLHLGILGALCWFLAGCPPPPPSISCSSGTTIKLDDAVGRLDLRTRLPTCTTKGLNILNREFIYSTTSTRANVLRPADSNDPTKFSGFDVSPADFDENPVPFRVKVMTSYLLRPGFSDDAFSADVDDLSAVFITDCAERYPMFEDGDVVWKPFADDEARSYCVRTHKVSAIEFQVVRGTSVAPAFDVNPRPVYDKRRAAAPIQLTARPPTSGASFAEWRVVLPDGQLATELRATSMTGDAFVSSYMPTSTGQHTFFARFDGVGGWVPLTTKVIDAIELGDPEVAVEKNSFQRNLRITYPILAAGTLVGTENSEGLASIVTVSKVTSLRSPLSEIVTVGDKCGVAKMINRPDSVEYRGLVDLERISGWLSWGDSGFMFELGEPATQTFPGKCRLRADGVAGLDRRNGNCDSVGWSNKILGEPYTAATALDDEVYVIESCVLPYAKLSAGATLAQQLAACSDRRWIAVSGLSNWSSPCF